VFAHPENELVGVQSEIAGIFFGGIADSGEQARRARGNIGSHPAVQRPRRIGAKYGIVFDKRLMQAFAVREEDSVVWAVGRRIVGGDLGAGGGWTQEKKPRGEREQSRDRA